MGIFLASLMPRVFGVYHCVRQVYCRLTTKTLLHVDHTLYRWAIYLRRIAALTNVRAMFAVAVRAVCSSLTHRLM